LGEAEADVECGGFTVVFAEADGAEGRVLVGEGLEGLPSVVGAAVVDDDDFVGQDVVLV